MSIKTVCVCQTLISANPFFLCLKQKGTIFLYKLSSMSKKKKIENHSHGFGSIQSSTVYLLVCEINRIIFTYKAHDTSNMGSLFDIIYHSIHVIDLNLSFVVCLVIALKDNAILRIFSCQKQNNKVGTVLYFLICWKNNNGNVKDWRQRRCTAFKHMSKKHCIMSCSVTKIQASVRLNLLFH